MRMMLIWLSAMQVFVRASYAQTKFEPFGFIKASWVASSQEVVSFADHNHSAVTHAALIDRSSPESERYSQAPRSSFQAQQSRAGFRATTEGHLQAHMEVDLVDRAESTHGAGEHVRLRLAYLSLPLGEDLELSFGQKWLTFAGVGPYTYNFIQIHYYSGKSGFIGQEVSLKYTHGAWTHYLAAGSKGVNTGSDQSATELGVLPALTYKSQWRLGNHLFGGAFMYGEMLNSQEPQPAYRDSLSSAVKLFADLNWEAWKLTTEVFYSENPEDLNLLALRGARYDRTSGQSSYVSGGFVSVRYAMNESAHIFGGLGIAQNGGAQDKFASGTLAHNRVIRFGGDKKIAPSARLFLEASSFKSSYVAGPGALEEADAMVYELGVIHNF